MALRHEVGGLDVDKSNNATTTTEPIESEGRKIRLAVKRKEEMEAITSTAICNTQRKGGL